MTPDPDSTTARRAHWQQAWSSKPATSTSWYQPRPELSLELIAATGIDHDAALIDIGGGASTLVDALLADGWSQLSVLDISAAALDVARQRLGVASNRVQWIEADLLNAQLPQRYAIWHDRAVFHFLTNDADRQRYRLLAEASIVPGGQLILGSFAEDGPLRCSGLAVQRHSIESLAAALGPQFALIESRREIHQTPMGSEQRFVYGRFLRRAA